MHSTIDAFENGEGPNWRWLRIDESLVIDEERGIVLARRSKRAWEVCFSEVQHSDGTVNRNRVKPLGVVQIYKHRPKDQPGGPYLLKLEREKLGFEGKTSFGQLKPAVLEAMRYLVLNDVVTRLTGER